MANKPKHLNVKQIFSVALILYFRNIKRFIIISFVLGFPMILLDLYTLFTIEAVSENSYTTGFVLLTILISALITILYPFNFVVLGLESYSFLLKKEFTKEQIFADSFKRIKAVFISGLFVFCMYTLFIYFFEPMGWMVKWIMIYMLSIFISLYPFIIAFEDVKAIDAIRRSFLLIRGNLLKVFIIMIIINFISPMNLWHYNVFEMLNFKPDMISVVGFSIIETITLPLQSLLLLIFYFDQRRQTEKFKLNA